MGEVVAINQVEAESLESHVHDRVVFSALEVGRCQRSMIQPVSLDTPMSEMDRLFQDPALVYVPVQDSSDQIVGYIIRERFRAFLGQSPFHRDLYMKPGYTVATVADRSVVVIDSHETLYEASRRLMERDADRLYDPFVITHKGNYFGMSNIRSVMDGLNLFSSRNMEACSSAQRAILQLPNKLQTQKIEIGYILEELDDLGGDLVYFNSLKKDLHFITSMDVSGKGLKASNMVIAIQSFLKASVDLFMLIAHKKRTTKWLMRLINKLNRMVAHNTPFDLYATGVFFVVDTKRMILDFYDYGHPPVYIIRQGKIRRLPSKPSQREHGIPFFGIDPDLVKQPNRIKLQHGDKIFVHSDGLDESRNIHEEEYGEMRLVSLLKELDSHRGKDIPLAVKDDLEIFRQGHRKMDDLSLVAFEVF